MKSKIPESKYDDIVYEYIEENLNCSQIARSYSVSYKTIRSILVKKGVGIRNDQSYLQQKFKLNQNFFSHIDEENKAYFLGLMFSDGSNFEKRNCISIGIHKKDKDILEKFKFVLNSDHPLHYPKGKDYVLLSIRNKKMSSDLAKLGCFSNKSLKLDAPSFEVVPEKLYKDFLRGYFDGDGNLNYYLDKRSMSYSPKITIVSTLVFCQKIKNFLKEKLKINSSIYKKNGYKCQTRSLCISGKYQVKCFLDYIYENHSVSLDRKRLKMSEWDNYIK